MSQPFLIGRLATIPSCLKKKTWILFIPSNLSTCKSSPTYTNVSGVWNCSPVSPPTLCCLLVVISDKILLLNLILSVLWIHFWVGLGLILFPSSLENFCFSSLSLSIWPLALWVRITTYKTHAPSLPLPEGGIWRIGPQSVTECHHYWFGNSSFFTSCLLERSDM